MIDLLDFCARLERNAETIRSMVDGMPPDEARWRPEPLRWSILEVMCHLLDEEREDFRQRIDYTLHRPGDDWPPIDPDGWVTSHDYASRKLSETLDAFLKERQSSIIWLQTLVSPNWELSRAHPAGYSLRAGDLLLSWLAHDYLHIRQLTKLRFDYASVLLGPYSSLYAGEWR